MPTIYIVFRDGSFTWEGLSGRVDAGAYRTLAAVRKAVRKHHPVCRTLVYGIGRYA